VPYRSLLNFIFAKTTQLSVIFAFLNFRKVDKVATQWSSGATRDSNPKCANH